MIALTANAFESDVQRSHEVGCDDHLTKPISQVALLDALARHVRRDAPQAPAGLPPTPPGSPPFAPVNNDLNGPDTQAKQVRKRAHARVFLGDWQQTWTSASADQRPRLADDLAEVAHQIGAAELCLATATLRAALGKGDEPRACRQLELALLPVLAELTDDAPPKPSKPV